MRYDSDRGIYRDCRWCKGTGCLQCASEAEKAYKAEFPNGPQPIATFTMEQLKSGALKGLLGPEAVASAKEEARKRVDGLALDILRQLRQDASEGDIQEAVEATFVPRILEERIVASAQK